MCTSLYSVVQKNSCILEFPAFLLPTKVGQPMHSPTAMMEFPSPNLAGTFLLDPVYRLEISMLQFELSPNFTSSPWTLPMTDPQKVNCCREHFIFPSFPFLYFCRTITITMKTNDPTCQRSPFSPLSASQVTQDCCTGSFSQTVFDSESQKVDNLPSTGHPFMDYTLLQEYCSQVEAEVVSDIRTSFTKPCTSHKGGPQ